MSESKIGLRVDEKDNVATVFTDALRAGDQVEIHSKTGKIDTIQICNDIPYGHKIALMDIAEGEAVIKYGESIGVVSSNIVKGEHVHIHNMKAGRGRGDL